MNKGKLILLVGIPGSGKTTLAKAIQEEDYRRQNNPEKAPETIILGRDNLRNLLFGYTDSNVHEHYTRTDFKSRETQITETQQLLVRQGLKEGKKVIVDDTNCQLDRLKKWLADYSQYDREIIILQTSLETCITRQAARVRKVSEEIIRKMYDNLQKILEKNLPLEYSAQNFQTYVPDTSLPKAVLVDLDGTCSLSPHRAMYGFLAEQILDDQLVEPVRDVVESLYSKGLDVIFLSGRTDNYRDVTEQWIQQHFSQLFAGNRTGVRLFMRKEGDYRKDTQVKYELFQERIKDNYHVQFAIDDRLSVLSMWNELGLFTFNVNQTLTWF